MSERFRILWKFLERFDYEVEGRESSEPTTEAKLKLERLARGNLPEKEQEQIFALLDRNPAWVDWLAREVKALRQA